MASQEQTKEWNEIKEIWGNSAKGKKINFQVSNLIEELKGKMTDFEKRSIKSDVTKIKSSWENYKSHVSQFEKDSVAKDLAMISKFLKRVFRRFKK